MDLNNEETVTVQSALQNAARLLHNAELETDLARMERTEKLADSWVSVATVLLVERDDT